LDDTKVLITISYQKLEISYQYLNYSPCAIS
jgi:hypothetical protein